MSFQEIRGASKEMLTAQDIAPVLGVNAQSIRMQARKDVRQLGFPASVIGTRLLIPRDGFIKWFTGGEQHE